MLLGDGSAAANSSAGSATGPAPAALDLPMSIWARSVSVPRWSTDGQRVVVLRQYTSPVQWTLEVCSAPVGLMLMIVSLVVLLSILGSRASKRRRPANRVGVCAALWVLGCAGVIVGTDNPVMRPLRGDFPSDRSWPVAGLEDTIWPFFVRRTSHSKFARLDAFVFDPNADSLRRAGGVVMGLRIPDDWTLNDDATLAAWTMEVPGSSGRRQVCWQKFGESSAHAFDLSAQPGTAAVLAGYEPGGHGVAVLEFVPPPVPATEPDGSFIECPATIARFDRRTGARAELAEVPVLVAVDAGGQRWMQPTAAAVGDGRPVLWAVVCAVGEGDGLRVAQVAVGTAEGVRRVPVPEGTHIARACDLAWARFAAPETLLVGARTWCGPSETRCFQVDVKTGAVTTLEDTDEEAGSTGTSLAGTPARARSPDGTHCAEATTGSITIRRVAPERREGDAGVGAARTR
ncbi:MAG: hypothetical protein U0625_04675 [Phycisphaerales bacterium]